MDKRSIRITIKEKLQTLSKEERLSQESMLYSQLFEMPEWKKAEVAACTISVGNELNTYPIFIRAWKEGKKIAAPVVKGSKKELDFYIVNKMEDCREAGFGLIEPDPSKCEYVSPEHIDLVITPGLAFDKEGFRIGYGGGFFDRFLQGLPVSTVSLVFQEQLMENIPRESFDVPVNRLLIGKRAEE
ncbi:5-formyltetrahydrofolate cyclo-ligase [Alkalicoccus saliphilus]|uniref:5-formyltetrahydrofolate cyclo-ligase n=1 Tax=Alkalicoccus saliphilus TaxID=200989 RepID=A0A2T4UAU1_9BACI|nr:5-formyltetrahydrofolate cyclo-ligase [Alkalicoccus saliphilus]PTL40503.1 5-formyltetrahydrofolate cyclo-ligase [Alkalicoccus saliphilus]